MKRLRSKMIDALEERNFPPKTVDAYVGAVADLSRHYKVSPDLLSPEQVRVWLELQRPKVADLVFQILVRGLAFFFVEVLRWPIVRKAKTVVSVVVRSRPAVSPLRQRMIEDMQRRNFSPRTIAAYVGAIGRFSRHFNNKCPTKMGATEIRTWQLILHDRGLSFSTYNTASCALRFLYCVVLGMPDMTTMIPFARTERKLPTILSQGEVCALVRAGLSDRDRIALVIAYACGLRVSELATLRVADVDVERRLLHVHSGKGRKDRLVPLADSLLVAIAEHQPRKPGKWLFPGQSAGRHIQVRTLQRVVIAAAKAAGISKHITPHILRHCFATHHLEARTDLRTVQSLLGHNSIATTIRYHHLVREVVTAKTSPADIIELLAR